MPAIKKLMDEVTLWTVCRRKSSTVLSPRNGKVSAKPKSSACSSPEPPRRKYMPAMQDQQEIMERSRHDDESYRHGIGGAARAENRGTKGEAAAACSCRDDPGLHFRAMEKIESAAKKVIAAVADGDMLRTQLAFCGGWPNMNPSTPSNCGSRLRRR